MPSFIIIGYVWRILGRGAKKPSPHHPWAARKKPILNRVNVVELADIPDFSKLEDIGTPLRLFESLFDDALVDLIVCYTKLYINREKAMTSFEIIDETFRLF